MTIYEYANFFPGTDTECIMLHFNLFKIFFELEEFKDEHNKEHNKVSKNGTFSHIFNK